MKFYLVIIQNQNTQAIYEYPSFDAALVKFHEELAYRAENRTSTFCMIMDGDGNIFKRETWPVAEGGES